MISRLAVCGLGKLGSPIAAAFAEVGMQVTGYDIDAKKVEAINWGRAPVSEPGLTEVIQKAGKRLLATTDPKKAVLLSDACIFVAPTPSLPDGSFDNGYLLEGIEKIASTLVATKRKTPYLFIVSSTVTPGSCEKVILPAIRKHSDLIFLIYKPEFIALGTVLRDLGHPDVALIGCKNKTIAAQACMLYAKLQVTHFQTMTYLEAELAKISLNCAITMKISFANQVGMIAEKLGANPHTVLGFVGLDSRVGKKALRPGMPFGGPCFPRDCRMFQYVADKVGVVPYLAMATDRVNEDILRFIVARVPVDSTHVGILGLAYKGGTSFVEASAGTALQLALTSAGKTVRVHDPLVAPYHLQDVLQCSTIIVTIDSPQYRELKFNAGTLLIDPLGVIPQKIDTPMETAMVNKVG